VFPPQEVLATARLFDDMDAPWAVAGGWALDLHLGRVTRSHSDVEVAVLRRDQSVARSALGPGWMFEVVIPSEEGTPGSRTPLVVDHRLELPVHEIHGEHPRLGRVELLLNEAEADAWIYRRDARVTRPLNEVFVGSPSGVPVLAPEVVLLFKSKDPREKDLADLETALRELADERVGWLRRAIATAHPKSPFVEML
jgi:hypothetical protein